MKRGKLITIEGIEGAGKSTALAFIKNYLLKEKKEVVWTREPGGTPLAETLRKLILHPESAEVITADTELLLMFAGRAQHLQEVIMPALQAGRWVVSDRFVDASYAYQGGGRGVSIDRIKYLDEWIVGQCQPDLTLLLDVEPALGEERAAKRGGEKDRIEQEKNDFFKRVRDAYLQRAKQAPERMKIINANLSLPEVEQQIKQVLEKWMIEQA